MDITTNIFFLCQICQKFVNNLCFMNYACPCVKCVISTKNQNIDWRPFLTQPLWLAMLLRRHSVRRCDLILAELFALPVVQINHRLSCDIAKHRAKQISVTSTLTTRACVLVYCASTFIFEQSALIVWLNQMNVAWERWRLNLSKSTDTQSSLIMFFRFEIFVRFQCKRISFQLLFFFLFF